ncbi:MAG: hypothetical protein WA190_03190 [Usitatibacter sp.]
MTNTSGGSVEKMTATSQSGEAVAAPGDPLVELVVMQGIAEHLQKLRGDTKAVRRVLQWAGQAFGVEDVVPQAPAAKVESKEPSGGSAAPEPAHALLPRFDSLPDFFSAAAPSRETDKALVVGYWVQVVQGTGEFDSFTINKELRHLGYAVANITSAFDNLINRKPQLVIQTRKSGTSQQARKMYKLTMEGQRAVERMLGDGQE